MTTRLYREAVRWAERNRDVAAGRLLALTAEAEAEPPGPWRQAVEAMAELTRRAVERWDYDARLYGDKLAESLRDDVGRELVARLEAEGRGEWQPLPAGRPLVVAAGQTWPRVA